MTKKQKTFKQIVVENFGNVQNCASSMGISTPTMHTYIKYPNNMKIGFFVNFADKCGITTDELFKIVNR